MTIGNDGMPRARGSRHGMRLNHRGLGKGHFCLRPIVTRGQVSAICQGKKCEEKKRKEMEK